MYRYIGPCRSGFGTNAFYQDEYGKILHAWQIFTPWMPRKEEEIQMLEDHAKILEEELEQIKKRSEELR
jgi:hypothetical protein